MSTSRQYLRMELKAIMESLLYSCIDLLSRETIFNLESAVDVFISWTGLKSKKDKVRWVGHRWGVVPQNWCSFGQESRDKSREHHDNLNNFPRHFSIIMILINIRNISIFSSCVFCNWQIVDTSSSLSKPGTTSCFSMAGRITASMSSAELNAP